MSIGSRSRAWASALAAVGTLAGSIVGCARPPDAARHYVGSDACTECHRPEAEQWRGSDHDRAMDVASDSTVQGDFSGATFRKDGVTTTFRTGAPVSGV